MLRTQKSTIGCPNNSAVHDTLTYEHRFPVFRNGAFELEIIRKPWPFGALTLGDYGVIVADPPWDFKTYSNKDVSKSPMRHYDLMSLDDIMALPVQKLARPDALLLLWTTGWAMAEGYAQEVARAWGAKPVSEMVWRKLTAKNRLPRMGTGYRVRSLHEPILVATWGKPKHKAFKSLMDGIVGEHSEKPIEFYDAVRKATGAGLLYRCDLFSAGVKRNGFEGWGEDHRVQEKLEARAAALLHAQQTWKADGPEQSSPGSGGRSLVI